MNNKEKEKEEPSSDEAKQSGRTSSEDAPVTETVEKTVEEKLAEANDKYLRLYADFENFRKRANKERLDQLKFAGEDILKQLIPVMDDFDRAMKASEKSTDAKMIREGVSLIYSKFKNLLTQSGVAEMNAIGKVFDSEVHDAVTNIPAPKPDLKGKVVEEVEKGYWLNGKVLRHAKVVVGN
jgi:molecular chaperone GrpE